MIPTKSKAALIVTAALVLYAFCSSPNEPDKVTDNDGDGVSSTNTGNAFGRLLDADGTPVAGAFVSLYKASYVPSENSTEEYVDTTDADGSYIIALPQEGVYNILGTDQDYGVLIDSVCVDSSDDSLGVADAFLKPFGAITGSTYIVGVDQIAQSNIFMFLSGIPRLPVKCLGGRFMFYRIPEGAYTLVLSPASFDIYRGIAVPCTVQAGIQLDLGTIVFDSLIVDPGDSNTPPIADFSVDPATGDLATFFSVDASACTDDEDGTDGLEVRWDWDNDGYWDTGYLAVKTASYRYSTSGTKQIRLEVRDSGLLVGTTVRTVTVSEPEPVNQLVAYWPFNENSGTVAADASGNGNTGDFVGTLAWETGLDSFCVAFHDDSYVNCGNDACLNFTTAFTLSAWFCTSMEASAGLIDKSRTRDNDCSYRLHKSESNDVIQFSVSSNGSPWAGYINSETKVNDGQWHHALGVYDGSADRLELYIDGISEGYIRGSVPERLWTNSLDVEIGRTEGLYCMDGVIDEVRMYNYALSGTEIASLYWCYGPDPVPVHWSFDEGEGGLASASGGQSYPFAMENAAWCQDGVSGTCAEFTYSAGAGGYAVQADTGFAACEERFTWSMWIYPYNGASGTQVEHILEKSYDADSDKHGYQLALNYGRFYFSISKEDGSWENGGGMPFGPVITAGRWYHLAITWDRTLNGGSLDGYVNGVKYAIYQKNSPLNVIDIPLLLGRYIRKPTEENYCFHGRIDELSLYEHALTEQQVRALYDEYAD